MQQILLVEQRSDLWPQTAYRPVDVHEWTDGRMESMRAQHLHCVFGVESSGCVMKHCSSVCSLLLRVLLSVSAVGLSLLLYSDWKRSRNFKKFLVSTRVLHWVMLLLCSDDITVLLSSPLSCFLALSTQI